MAFFANGRPKHPNDHCEAFLEFLGSSQVATLNDVENHCDNLIKSFTENRGGVEDTRLEAKAKDTKKFQAQGQAQTPSRPRSRTKDTNASVLQKKRSSKKFF